MEEKNAYRRTIWFFIVICFGWSWLSWMPEIVWGIKLYTGPFGPLVAAFLLVYVNNGRQGVAAMLESAVKYKGSLKWLIPVIFFMPLFAALSYFLAGMSGEELPGLELFRRPWLIPLKFLYILLLGGPLQEEFGWRGYLLPVLQKRLNALLSSVILGIIWAMWHFPLNFTPGQAGPQYEAAFQMLAGSVIMMIALSIIFTWIFNNTGGSTMMALLLHAILNLSTYELFPLFRTKTGPGIFLLLLVITAVVIVLIYGRRQFVRTK